MSALGDAVRSAEPGTLADVRSGFDRSLTLCSTQAASSRRASSSDAGVTGMNRGSLPPTARGANQIPRSFEPVGRTSRIP